MSEALRKLMKPEIDAVVNAAVNEFTLEMAAIMIENREPASKIQRYTKVNLDKLQELSEQLGIALVM